MNENEEVVEEVVEMANYIDVMVDLLVSEANNYHNNTSDDARNMNIKNVCALAAQINEANKITNDSIKTELEVDLKNRMNERDNEVRRETMAQELKQRKNEMIANKIESGAALGVNIAKNVATAKWIGGMAEAEFNGYVDRSQTIKHLTDFGKQSIKVKGNY